MKFLRSHGAATAVGAALGAGSAIGASYHLLTPEPFLSRILPQIADKLAVLLGFSDLHEMAPWWARDVPLYWMLPVTAVLVWFLSASCRPRSGEVAAFTFAFEQDTMTQARTTGALVEVQRAELRTPASKQFGKLDRDAAEQAAHTHVVTKAAADLLAAQSAHAEYAGFLEESLAEYRLLRLEAVAGYVLGFLASFFYGVRGLAAVPLLALTVPVALFVLLVVANVTTSWAMHLLAQTGLCQPGAPSGAAAWSLDLRDARAGEWLAECCASVGACFAALRPTNAQKFWGVKLRDANKTPPPEGGKMAAVRAARYQPGAMV